MGPGLAPPVLLEWVTDKQIDALVRGYSDEQLADLHRTASEQPGTEWVLLLSAEIARRRRGLATVPEREL
jgi:hypothetical protein